jgi:Sigma-70, region 4
VDLLAIEFVQRVKELRAEGKPAPGRRHVANDRNMEILQERLIDGFTLDEIAQHHGLGRERIRQILNLFFDVRGVPPATRERIKQRRNR